MARVRSALDKARFDNSVPRFILVGGPPDNLVFDRLTGRLLGFDEVTAAGAGAEIGTAPAWYMDSERIDGSTLREIANSLIPPNPSTTVTAGAPGSFDKDVPYTLAALNALGIGAGAAWTPGQYVTLRNNTKAYWNGATFLAGAVPNPSTSVTAGAPGSL